MSWMAVFLVANGWICRVQQQKKWTHWNATSHLGRSLPSHQCIRSEVVGSVFRSIWRAQSIRSVFGNKERGSFLLWARPPPFPCINLQPGHAACTSPKARALGETFSYLGFLCVICHAFLSCRALDPIRYVDIGACCTSHICLRRRQSPIGSSCRTYNKQGCCSCCCCSYCCCFFSYSFCGRCFRPALIWPAINQYCLKMTCRATRWVISVDGLSWPLVRSLRACAGEPRSKGMPALCRARQVKLVEQYVILVEPLSKRSRCPGHVPPPPPAPWRMFNDTSCVFPFALMKGHHSIFPLHFFAQE